MDHESKLKRLEEESEAKNKANTLAQSSYSRWAVGEESPSWHKSKEEAVKSLEDMEVKEVKTEVTISHYRPDDEDDDCYKEICYTTGQVPIVQLRSVDNQEPYYDDDPELSLSLDGMRILRDMLEEAIKKVEGK